MDIGYVTRSSFLGACEAAVRARRSDLEHGGTIHVDLGDGGYDGRVVVTINPADQENFAADWTSSDPTRFPARIKAAATALRNCGCVGSFEVSHADGSLAIREV